MLSIHWAPLVRRNVALCESRPAAACLRCAVAQCFARCCTLLRTLRLQECKSVSDVGLLQVSNHCPALEVLDVSRSELAYKVTDVAMLALGERCHQLTDVNLSGCSFLTDAGIDWLVGGCHLITTLKLPGLYKLTDTGGCCSVWALVSLVCFPQCGVDGKGAVGMG